MLDVAFDLIFEQHLLGLDDKLGAKTTGHWAVDHRSLWFCVQDSLKFQDSLRLIRLIVSGANCC